MDAQNSTDPGNAFTLGIVIGKLETRCTASETALASMTVRLTAIETRIDEGEKRNDVFRDAMLLLAANAEKRVVWKPDDATGEDVLTLDDAPVKTGASSKATVDPKTGENNWRLCT
jgi:hypothetical protein